jgi:hypothetical protein
VKGYRVEGIGSRVKQVSLQDIRELRQGPDLVIRLSFPVQRKTGGVEPAGRDTGQVGAEDIG